VKKLKNNYILRLYVLLGLILVATVVCMSILLYRNAASITSKELTRLNETVIYRMSREAGTSTSEATTLCNKIAIDSKLIALLQQRPNQGLQSQLDEYLSSLVTGYMWQNKNILMEAYVIGYRGLNYAQYDQIFTLDEIKSSEEFHPAFEPLAETILSTTARSDEEAGIYRYSIKAIREIRDLITKDPCGIVIIRISENYLYATYKEIILGGADAYIVDKNWNVLSAKNKNRIGTELITPSETKEQAFREKGSLLVQDDGKRTLYIYSRITGTQWYLVEQIDAGKIFEGLENIQTISILITCGVVLVVAYLAFLFRKKTEDPIQQIKSRMLQVALGDLSVRADVNRDDEFGKMGESFNAMVDQINRLIQDVKQEEKQKRLVEMDFLQAQINPHFIHNTLSSIRFNIEIGNTKAADEMIILFSRVLRKTLSRSDEFIDLDDEINTIRDYVELQKLRYSESIHVSYELDAEAKSVKIPTFILQPLVENAIFHNADSCDIIRIRIESRLREDHLEITITDNGKGMSQQQIETALSKGVTYNKVGIYNVHERLQLTYGISNGLEIHSGDGQGTMIRIRIPIENRNDEATL
jgi:two-component system sensor histidine kinase YesM